MYSSRYLVRSGTGQSHIRGSLGSENRGERFAKLIGVAEIAEMLRRQGIDKLIRAHGDFPARRLVLIAGRICERVVVERCARENGRIK